MRPFKFFHNPIAKAYDGGYIYAGEHFYSMNKEEFIGVTGRPIEKYTILRRMVLKKYEDVFKPDYNTLIYFRTKESAEFHKGRLIHWDEHVVGSREIGEEFHRQAEHTITFNR